LPFIYLIENNLFKHFNEEQYPKNWSWISDKAPPYNRNTIEECRQYFSKALEGYISQGGDINEIDFKEAGFRRNVEVVKLLIAKQTNLKVASRIGGMTVLEDALDNAVVDSDNPSSLFEIPWITTSIDDSRQIVKIILNAGVNRSSLSSPLRSAADASDFELMKILINYGADVNTEIREPSIPVRVMESSSPSKIPKKTIIKLLIDSGFCGVNIKDRFGESPLEVAKERGYPEIVRMFEELHRVKKSC
jgi:ankyrin repeat protein